LFLARACVFPSVAGDSFQVSLALFGVFCQAPFVLGAGDPRFHSIDPFSRSQPSFLPPIGKYLSPALDLMQPRIP
jgi:hypothetical protein